jgi:hypothetical protein
MREIKELLNLNFKDLTGTEIDYLLEKDYNFCDKCGQIDTTYDLLWDTYWIEDEFLTVEILNKMAKYSALCRYCYEEYLIKAVAQGKK